MEKRKKYYYFLNHYCWPIGPFRIVLEQNTKTMLRGQNYIFLCTNKGKCKFVPSASSFLFCSNTTRKWTIAMASFCFFKWGWIMGQWSRDLLIENHAYWHEFVTHLTETV